MENYIPNEIDARKCHSLCSLHSTINLWTIHKISLLCRYHVACSEPGAYMSVTLSGLQLEPDSAQCADKAACRDYLHLTYPTGWSDSNKP